MRTAVLVGLLVTAAACGRPPEATVRIQGRVRTVGLLTPIPGADVTVEWPAALGAGQTLLKTNAAGEYIIERTVRARELTCEDLAITVSSPQFASAYHRHSEPGCEDLVLTVDFSLHPLPQ